VAGEQRAAVEVMLDALYSLPDHAGSDLDGYLGRLADGGVNVVRAGDGLELCYGESPSWRSRARVSSIPHASLIRPSVTRKK
jgi:hypothetical protein